jgi:DNA-binding CsgD family transcriptional regulator
MDRHTDHYREPWFWECVDRGHHPRECEADDVLGPMDDRIRYTGPEGRTMRVLLRAELNVNNEEGETVNEYDLAQSLYGDSAPDEAIVAEATVIAVLALLTPTEAAIAGAIMDGSGSDHGYSERIAERLGTTPQAVRKAWSRAKRKLRKDWAA